MARSVYVASVEGHSGKSVVALGLLALLTREVGRVGVFRPIARGATDPVLDTLLRHTTAEVDFAEAVGVTYDDVHADGDAALARIVERYKAVEARCDAVVVVGSDFTDVSSPTELSFNARIAANLGTPVVLVLGGRDPAGAEQLGQAPARPPAALAAVAEPALRELADEHAGVVAVVLNRADPERLAEGVAAVQAVTDRPVWAIPEEPFLIAPTFRAVAEAVDGELVAGDPELMDREAMGVVVAAMSMVNVLPRLTEGAVVVVPGDRPDVVLAVMTAHAAGTYPSPTGILLNGGIDLPEPVLQLIAGLGSSLPIVATQLGTFDTTARVIHTRGLIASDSPRKTDTSLALFEEAVDTRQLLDSLDVGPSAVVTPLMFEHLLTERARAAEQHVVLPEGDDDRVLRAAATVLSRRVARLTILGEEAKVRGRASELGLDIAAAEVVSPFDEELRGRFAREYAGLRAHRGMTEELAWDVVPDVSYFGTMMVQLGLVDGMVSGAAHTTAHTIRPAFEIIRTRPGVSVVSSVFLMALADRVLVYGDCAVNPLPDAAQLADIAISSAATAARFGIEPRVAMLSYSTGDSGSGADVDKVREATRLVHERAPELVVDGPMQYDAAADPAVGASKMPGSPVAGRATVFVFPDLNTGNNTYKAVQRSAGAVAMGPVLQGLNKPVNDLSRGATVRDIVNTIALTAVQAAGS
ncbi:phosphate acetyltransferase [Klenkia terrae]|uniref:Phosphate acetyltransferase n=1 Tax=Klenkia terrae TaxID=1052259 RepID=A0ABU8E0D3_9ACTN|nr:phosphate acetyltransferase [Klenkia terrae]